MSRITRSVLPTNEEKLKPKIIKEVAEQLSDLRKIQKIYHDRNTVQAPTINIGDNVRMQRGKRDWIAAKATEQTDKPRSFIVEAKNGQQYRRNTIHLRRTAAQIDEQPSIVVEAPSNQPLTQQNNDHQPAQPPNQQQDQSHVQHPTKNTTEPQRAQIDQRPETSTGPTRSRYGRLIKKVVKMNL